TLGGSVVQGCPSRPVDVGTPLDQSFDQRLLLLEHHAYIDAESPNGTTPLMMAAYYGTPEATKLLLEEGADPLIKNQQGLTALDFALNGPHKEAVAYVQAFTAAAQARSKQPIAAPK
ncbi:MAG: ankyrin repeat domain-containing protein, partial [Betaproteobacteria bacterium]|nr:ankyrin repeat domain-containing protein [Betaproteobacteria bacterium]